MTKPRTKTREERGPNLRIGIYPALRLAALPQTGEATLPLQQLALSTP